MVENSMPAALVPTVPADLAPEKFLEWLQARCKQASTATIYYKVALRWHTKAVGAVSTAPVLTYLQGLQGKSSGTIGTCTAAAIKWCTWWSEVTGAAILEARGIRAVAPKMCSSQRRAQLDDETATALLAACQAHLAPPGLWVVPLLVTSPLHSCEACRTRITDLYWHRETLTEGSSARVAGIRLHRGETLLQGEQEQVLWLPDLASEIATRAATAATVAGREWLFPSPVNPQCHVSETAVRAALHRVLRFLPEPMQGVTPLHLRYYALRKYRAYLTKGGTTL